MAGTSEKIDARRAPRWLFEARFRICVERDSSNLVFEGWARDISESGLGAFVAQELHRGESVILKIPMPKSGKISLDARVARCLGTQYGFQFTTLSADQRVQIQALGRDREVTTATHSTEDDPGNSSEGENFMGRMQEMVKRGYKP